jgi:hypothetical protein
MGTKLASAIMGTVAGILQDEAFDRWTEAVLFEGLNYGQREIVLLKPDANRVSGAVKLGAGINQALPADGVSLFSISHNMGTSGTAPGRVITQVALSKLIAYNPYLAASATSTEVRHYAYDDHDPLAFTVFPPQPASGQGYVFMIYSGAPAEMVKPAGSYDVAINLPDVYVNPLTYFALYWAYIKDSDFSPTSAARAEKWYQLFMALLSRKEQAEVDEAGVPAAQHEVG